jgi:hypothetical protein
LKNNFLIVGHVRFALNTVFLISNVFASLRKYFLFYLMCSLRFENNLLTIEGVRFVSISKKTPLSKLSFAFVSPALPLLHILHVESRQSAVRRCGFYSRDLLTGEGGGGRGDL